MNDTFWQTDVVVVGAGPVGLELAVALKQAGIEYLQFEAGQIGHTISWWPRNTRFFSSPERIGIAGVPLQTVDQEHATGEQYLAYLRSVAMQFNLEVNAYEPVERIERWKDGFRVHTRHGLGKRSFTCRRVVLATGGLSEPNRLNIPGEDLPHVTHYFDDPHAYFRQRLLVVGGRNSALEAALRSWRAGADVTLSYRHSDFRRGSVKNFLLDDIETRIRMGQILFLPATIPVEITPEDVTLAPALDGLPVGGERICVPADFVVLTTGYSADMRLFEMLGVQLTGPERAPVFNAETLETNVPGVYVAGTVAGGTQNKFTLFIETSHQDIPKIITALQRQNSLPQ
jgi:thioredoxin reductase (NADPH)